MVGPQRLDQLGDGELDRVAGVRTRRTRRGGALDERGEL
jgi:hypothetical protein